MPFVNILIHAVWETKNRFPFLKSDIRLAIMDHIIQNAKSKGIIIECINGYHDHLHCVFRLNKEMSISKAMQLIKGESSYWANKVNLTSRKFEWADEYYAASVSESILPQLRKYIDNQDEHHRKHTFEEEYQKFIESISKG